MIWQSHHPLPIHITRETINKIKYLGFSPCWYIHSFLYSFVINPFVTTPEKTRGSKHCPIISGDLWRRQRWCQLKKKKKRRIWFQGRSKRCALSLFSLPLSNSPQKHAIPKIKEKKLFLLREKAVFSVLGFVLVFPSVVASTPVGIPSPMSGRILLCTEWSSPRRRVVIGRNSAARRSRWGFACSRDWMDFQLTWPWL